MGVHYVPQRVLFDDCFHFHRPTELPDYHKSHGILENKVIKRVSCRVAKRIYFSVI